MKLPRYVWLVLFCCVLVGLGVVPTNAEDRSIGGLGGVPFRVDCGPFGVLVGITGRSGNVIDTLGGLCVKIDPVVGIWVGPVYPTPRYGGTGGGGEFTKQCAVGQALVALSGKTTIYNDSHVVGSIGIECWDLAMDSTVIEAGRGKSVVGDFDPACYSTAQRFALAFGKWTWSRVGIALEGRSGLYVDRINLLCGAIPADTKPWSIAFQPSTKITVPEGTPMTMSWRTSNDNPEVTANLNYNWTLVDWSRPSPIPVATPVANPCAYALQPCSFAGTVASSNLVTFNNLAAGEYELQLTVAPKIVTIANSKAGFKFTIRPNLIESLTFAQTSVQPGSTTTAIVKMEGPAPLKGYVLHLSSSNPDLIMVPATIKVPPGADKATFDMRANPNLGGGGQATISVSAKLPSIPVVAVGKAKDISIYTRGLDDETRSELSPPPVEAEEQAAEKDVVESEGVTERGVRSKVSPQASAIAPTATVSSLLPHATAQDQSTVKTIAAINASLPSDTKQAVLSVLTNNIKNR